MKIILFLMISSFVFQINFVRAQGDYIITTANDTLRGEVTRPLIGKPRFKETGKTQSIPITIKSAKEYFRVKSLNKHETFVAKALPGKSKLIFLEQLEDGRLQLFLLANKTQGMSFGGVAPVMSSNSSNTWYISKDGGPLKTIKTSGLSFSRAEKEANFKEMLGDNTALWSKFEVESDFSFDTLRKYIVLYNKEKK